MGRIDEAIEKAVAISESAKDPMAETVIITNRNEPIDKRKDKRYSKKLTVKISSGNLRRSGIMKDVSKNGMFVMSGRDFTKDMVINIKLLLPNKDFFSQGPYNKKYSNN